MFAPYIRVTDDYGRLICSVVETLGSVPTISIQDAVVRDLLSDVFDFLYEGRRIIMNGQCTAAFPLLRRAFESLSLMVACSLDPALAERWNSGVKIPNCEVRKKLAGHPMGETAEVMREDYDFFSEAAHPNRKIIPCRQLGDGSKFVLGAILLPEPVLITEYCLHHLNLWFWFGASVSSYYADVLNHHDSEYLGDYLTVAKAAQLLAPALQSEFNRLLEEVQLSKPLDNSH